ncbi:MAG: iron-sulfur cluster assembly accessory protein [Candidatus Heimdallarchaeota archaeon]
MVELSLNFDIPKGTMNITDSAAKKINELLEAEGRVGQAIQITVIPGGCAGFSYQFGWINDDADGELIQHNGAKLLVKNSDMRLLAGSTLDYTVSLKGSKFEIINPNAASTCGCGKSFA